MARLLAEQGHVTRAREVLGVVLERSPGDAQAAELERTLRDRRDTTRKAEPVEEVLPPPVPGDPARLAAAFSRPRTTPLLRLRAFLARVQEARHEPPR